MKLEELKSRDIILFALGERGPLKSEDELSQILKKRLTKKERLALNLKISGIDTTEALDSLKVDNDRYEIIIAGAIKKMKNETMHKEFYMMK